MTTDGHNIKQAISASAITNLLDSQEFAQADFNLEGANMGIVKTTHAISGGLQRRYIKNHCVNCIDYTHRGAIAQGMLDMDYEGSWDFDTCHTTCWHDRRTKHNDIMRVYSHKYYWDNKNGVLNNRRVK